MGISDCTRIYSKLAQSDNISLLVLDLDDAFVVVNFTGGSKYTSPSDLEEYADKFDFSMINPYKKRIRKNLIV